MQYHFNTNGSIRLSVLIQRTVHISRTRSKIVTAPPPPTHTSPHSYPDVLQTWNTCAIFLKTAATLLPPKTKPVEGRFLFRSSGVEGEYIVSVIFKEKVTHHTLSFQGDTFKLNKKTDLKVGTLEAVHEHLKSKQKPYWPLKLLQGVVCEPVLISNSTVGADVRRQRRVSAGGVDQFKSEKQLMQACYTGQNRMVS